MTLLPAWSPSSLGLKPGQAFRASAERPTPQARSWSNTIFSIDHCFPLLPPQMSGSSQPTETQILQSRIWLLLPGRPWASSLPLPSLPSPKPCSPRTGQLLAAPSPTVPLHVWPLGKEATLLGDPEQLDMALLHCPVGLFGLWPGAWFCPLLGNARSGLLFP